MRSKSLTYVLRLWQSEPDGKPVWHASLHNPYTEERYNFSDLAVLVSFLRSKTEQELYEDSGAHDTTEVVDDACGEASLRDDSFS